MNVDVYLQRDAVQCTGSSNFCKLSFDSLKRHDVITDIDLFFSVVTFADMTRRAVEQQQR